MMREGARPRVTAAGAGSAVSVLKVPPVMRIIVSIRAMSYEAIPHGARGIGNLLAVILDFLIIALALFAVVKAINKLRSIGKEPEEPVEEEAPSPTSEELLTEIRDLLKDKQ